jgi:hypothetical protein
VNSVICPIVGFVLLAAVWVVILQAPHSLIYWYVALAINSGLLVWFIGKALGKGGSKTEKDPPIWYCPVDLYFRKPIEEYEELGIVYTEGSPKEPIRPLISDLQQKASNIGANGIFIQPPTTETDVIKITANAIRINKLVLAPTRQARMPDSKESIQYGLTAPNFSILANLVFKPSPIGDKFVTIKVHN